MCGDLEEDGGMGEALCSRFRSNAERLLQVPPAGSGQNAVLDKLFHDALSRALRDQAATEDSGRYDLLSMQPLVFARLAGFVAGHAALQEDPLRRVIEALMLGYGEAARSAAHHYGHEHPHDHDHEHGHHH